MLEAMIKAHEIQGVLALENSLNRVGLDHVLFVKVATTAVATKMLGGGKNEIMNAVSTPGLITAGAHIPARAEYRFAQIMGGRRCNQQGRGACACCDERGNGLSNAAFRTRVGIPGRDVQRERTETGARSAPM